MTNRALDGAAGGEQFVTNSSDLPIAVDLDGTLLRADTLHEGLVDIFSRRPWLLFPLLLQLLRGKAAFKQYVTRYARIDTNGIPVNSGLLDFLREEHGRGRRLGLFSAADQSIVAMFAERFGIFDLAVGSDGSRNLSGALKLAEIRERFGNSFVYAGDARVDLTIWREATAAIVVGRSRRIRDEVARHTPIEQTFVDGRPGVAMWLRALRGHQWAKNGLVFVPALLSLPTLQLLDLIMFLLAFLSLSAVASATYVLNDLIDLSSDRRHRTKRARPFASGKIPLSQAIVAVAGLTILVAAIASLLPNGFLVALLAYAVTTIAYSFVIKRVAMLDTLCLGFLFTLRIAAGAVLLEDDAAPYWLFAFSMFFFTSLAFVKRYTELLAAAGEGKSLIAGRGYQVRDLPVILAAGLGSALCSLVVFLIYLGDQHFNRALFSTPMWLGLAGGVLAYWLLRIWLLSVRDEMHDDPVLFALKDKTSFAMAMLVGVALLLAW
jgi:4-hydroxybenzoate polyprenyltransferase